MSNPLRNNKGKLFRPTFSRGGSPVNSYIKDSSSSPIIYDSLFVNTNLESSASYRYGDKPALVSTQQVKLDWSKFENHTFFHSAVANVNEAFDRIINFYPLGGTKKEIEAFEDTLTGFEKWVLDRFPKNTGYLNFSGSAVGETLNNGTYIEVKDSAGSSITSISKNQTGASSLNPYSSPFSFEFFIKLPEQANDNQIIAQKFSTLANNVTLALSESASSSSALLYFSIASGSSGNFLYNHVTGSVKKGEFIHVTAQYDKEQDGKLNLIIDNALIESANKVNFGPINLGTNSLFIGKGSDFRYDTSGKVFTQKQSYSGSVDDFKVFHKMNSQDYINKNKHKSYYPEKNNDYLRLHYRFNEPYGDYVGNNIILDSSKFSLHSTITNFNLANRLTGSDNPVTSEDGYRNPVLFPTFTTVDNLNYQLLVTASLYDDYNPNLITKLIPSHYFQEATNFRDYQDELEQLEERFSSISNGNVAKKVSDIPSIQILIKLLLVYAKHFDEIKILIDAITNFRFTDYDENESTPNTLLLEKAKVVNTVLPKILGYGSIEQIFEGIDLTDQKTKSAKTLNEIQNLIWRRILTDAPKNKKRKGTEDSIKSIFRSAGIEPDNILDFREYGGSKIKNLKASKEYKKDVIHLLSFTSSIGKTGVTEDSLGFAIDSEVPHLKSGFLFIPRTQEGYPPLDGLINSSTGVSTIVNDGLLTSGSFTYDSLYKWENGFSQPESLIRIHTTGSIFSPCILNLVATSKDSLSLYVKENQGIEKKELLLSGANIFDGDIWNVSFGKKDLHDFESAVSASFFIRAAKQRNGEIIASYATSSLFKNTEYTNYTNADYFKKTSSSYNASGCFLLIGSQSLPKSGLNFLNKGLAIEKTTNFFGTVGNIRFYSKFSKEEEWKERVKNYASIGVDDPIKNYNYNTLGEGSFERIVLHTDVKQSTQTTNASGEIRLFDFSKNGLHFEGKNFPASVNVMKANRTRYEVLSDKFDINYSKDKIRIRSFQDTTNLENSLDFAEFAPVNELITSEESIDDNRLSLDMSVMKGLNRNILSIFSDLDSFNDYLGSPNLIFAEHYPDLQFLRSLYFNNLEEKVNLQKYREIFKWIDGSFTEAVYSVVPRNTNFLGINFIYESHVLERNRVKYYYDKIYLNREERDEFTFDPSGITALAGNSGESFDIPRSPPNPPTTATPIIVEIAVIKPFEGLVKYT